MGNKKKQTNEFDNYFDDDFEDETGEEETAEKEEKKETSPRLKSASITNKVLL